MSRPTLAVTLGDVAGIGPEITAKALLHHPGVRRYARPVVVGDTDALRNAVAAVGADPGAVNTIADPQEAADDPATIDIIQTGPSLGHVPPGELNAEAGDGAARYVIEAVDLARRGRIEGIVTPPLNKAAMHLGGHPWPGHTELLAHEFGVSDYSLVLSAGDLSFFHLTTHVSLRQAISGITRERSLEVLRLMAAFARAQGNGDEPIGVAGLNPHAGENRLFGDEDADILAPAVELARAEGINAHGPLPADALIPAAVQGSWRLVAVCYHDQGHAPFKAVYGDDGVNITAGLPVVRVSVDHGTAFDIAGQGIAREASLVLSLRRAAELAPGWGHVWRATGAED